MIKARVSKNLKGTIVLPTISPFAISANKEVYFSENQINSADIQGALAKKLLIIVDGPTQSNVKFSKVTNLSFGSVTLPGANAVLRAGKSMDVNSELIDTPVYRQMISSGLIAVDLKLKTGAAKVEEIADADLKPKAKAKNEPKPKKGKKATKELLIDEEADPIIPANMQIGRPITVQPGVDAEGRGTATPTRGNNAKVQKAAAKKGTPDKKTNKHAVRKIDDDGLLLDLNAPDVEEEAEDFLLDPRTGKKVTGDDGIIFVDQEQAATRMNPRLKAIQEAKAKNK